MPHFGNMTIEKANGTVVAGGEVSRQSAGLSNVSAGRIGVAPDSGAISSGIDTEPVGPVIVTDLPAVGLVAALVAVFLDVANDAVSCVVGLFD